MKVSRKFDKLKKQALLVFAQRIQRNAKTVEALDYPTKSTDQLNADLKELAHILGSSFPGLNSKQYTIMVKSGEVTLRKALHQMADHIDGLKLDKYDFGRSGFHSQSPRGE